MVIGLEAEEAVGVGDGIDMVFYNLSTAIP